MAKLAPIIHERCDELIDAVRPQGRAEVVAALCYPLPAATMFALIGFPAGDGEQIKSWCKDNLEVVWGRPSPDRQVRSARGMVAFLDHCRKLVCARRADPADDLVSDLIADERELTDEEVSSMVFALSLAGHETTTNLLGNVLVQLLSRPAVWDEVRADRSLVSGAVEETLRFDTSVPVWRRVTTRETVLVGATLPAGARLLLAFGASNRQADHFPDPHRFDVCRAVARRQLSFGKGVHLCPGAALARLESEIVLNALADRLPGLRLVKDQRVSYPPLISFRGPRTLYLEWD